RAEHAFDVRPRCGRLAGDGSGEGQDRCNRLGSTAGHREDRTCPAPVGAGERYQGYFTKYFVPRFLPWVFSFFEARRSAPGRFSPDVPVLSAFPIPPSRWPCFAFTAASTVA